jgi:hypothetical protein
LSEQIECAFWFELKSQSPADATSMVETQRPGQSQVAKKLSFFTILKNSFNLFSILLCGRVNGSNARCVSVQTEFLLWVPHVVIPLAR